jgi:DNA-directed RNA polymerase sigma subunit (sigma70/sigma32)
VPRNRRTAITACTLLYPGPLILEQVGQLLGVTRERIRQIEAGALKKLRRAAADRGLDWAALAPEARQQVPGFDRASDDE